MAPYSYGPIYLWPHVVMATRPLGSCLSRPSQLASSPAEKSYWPRSTCPDTLCTLVYNHDVIGVP